MIMERRLDLRLVAYLTGVGGGLQNRRSRFDSGTRLDSGAVLTLWKVSYGLFDQRDAVGERSRGYVDEPEAEFAVGLLVDGLEALMDEAEVPDEKDGVIGTAALLPDDDARARSRTLPCQWDAAMGRMMASAPLTVRIDLDPLVARQMPRPG